MERDPFRFSERTRLNRFPWTTAEEALAYREEVNGDIIDPSNTGESLEAATAFDEQLETLPRENPELAKALYAAMARHERDEIRMSIAVRIDLLLDADKDAAARIWLDLFDDDCYDIREGAYETLTDAVERGHMTTQQAEPYRAAYALLEQERAQPRRPQNLPYNFN